MRRSANSAADASRNLYEFRDGGRVYNIQIIKARYPERRDGREERERKKGTCQFRLRNEYCNCANLRSIFILLHFFMTDTVEQTLYIHVYIYTYIHISMFVCIYVDNTILQLYLHFTGSLASLFQSNFLLA